MQVNRGDLLFVPNVGPCEVLDQDPETGTITLHSDERGPFEMEPDAFFDALLALGLGYTEGEPSR